MGKAIEAASASCQQRLKVLGDDWLVQELAMNCYPSANRGVVHHAVYSADRLSRKEVLRYQLFVVDAKRGGGAESYLAEALPLWSRAYERIAPQADWPPLSSATWLQGERRFAVAWCHDDVIHFVVACGKTAAQHVLRVVPQHG